MESSEDWRHDYPWGKKSPAKRIEDLEARRKKIERQRRLLQASFDERMIGLQRGLEAVEAETSIARSCEEDRLRRRIKAVAHSLYDMGLDVLDEVAAKPTSEESLADLEKLKRRHSAKKNDADMSDQEGAADRREDQPEPDDGLLSDDIVTVDEIIANQPENQA